MKVRIVGIMLFMMVIHVAKAVSLPIINTPLLTKFGAIPEATFDRPPEQGFRNMEMTIVEFELEGYDVILALTAHADSNNINPANDQAGTYYAMMGGDVYNPQYAKWNLGIYTLIPPELDKYQIALFMDSNPAIGNRATSRSFPLNGLPEMTLSLTDDVDMDIHAYGQYGFQLSLVDTNDIDDSPRGLSVAILVNVNIDGKVRPTLVSSVPDFGETVLMLGMTLPILVGLGKKNK